MKAKAQILFEYIPVLLAFLLPFTGNYLSLFVILWFFVALFNGNKQTVIEGLKNKWFLLLFGFIVFHCVSALFSENKTDALTSVEVKLSFLAFPVYIFLFNYKAETIKKIFIAFVSGCFFALLVCVLRAVFYFVTGGEDHFFYTAFSYFMHAGYFSMYMLFAFVIIQLAYPIWFKGDAIIKWFRNGFSIAFIIGIFLCASKIGIIAFFITLIILVLAHYKDKLDLKTGLLSILLISALTFVTYKIIPTPFERLRSAFATASGGNIDKTSSESTAVRMLIWKESAEIFKENFWLGTGSGDANDELHKRYEEHGLTGALEHNLNAHNQFFQTGIALGVFGLLILLVSIMGAIIQGFARKNLTLVIFSVIIFLNFLVESMLQTQAGNLFFVYFLCLLLKYNPQRLEEAMV